ncbi:tyrosine-type recombinase/integrase [Planctomycetota bacterium]
MDFHSLRHTTGSLLAASGVHPKVAQSIMRHSDINLTVSIYTHLFRGQKSQAVESLPDFSRRLGSNPKYG